MAYSSDTTHSSDSVYMNTMGGTTYFFSSQSETEGNLPEQTGPTSEPPAIDLKHTYSGPASHVTKIQTTNPLFSSFLTIDEVKQQLLKRNEITNTLPPTNTSLPTELENYHSLVPLETTVGQKIPQIASTFKATNSADGIRYCLRRLHGCRLQSLKTFMQVLEKWKKLQSSNIVKLREVFTSKAFGDHSLILVYDYHAGAETLLSRYFRNPETGAVGSFSDRYASRTNNKNLLYENELWWIIMQLTAAVRVVHTNNMACRTLDPTKVIFTGKRLRLSFLGVSDIVLFDPNESSPFNLITHHQQEDLTSLGKLILALACKNLQSIQRDRIQSSIEMVSRVYSNDLRHLILYLLSTNERCISECMPMIGARFYVQIDALQTQTDILEDELSKEMENGRLYRLLVKLGSINERPGLVDMSW